VKSPFSGEKNMTAQEVLAQLKKLGSESTKKTLMRHGAKEPFFGVKVADLKTIQKKVKRDHALSLELFDSGNSDAMYLAGLIADPPKMTKAQLQKWVKAAYWYMLSCYTVPWVASESNFGRELALEWMDSSDEQIASAGWSTYSCLVAIKPDAELDLPEIEKLLGRVKTEIGSAQNRVRYCMVQFIISVGGYVTPLNAKAKAVAKTVGKVAVDMGDTSCKVPDAVEYIAKIEKMGRVGKKRKTAMC
jgi:3-methyladenine DNA glycosylase AlkD